MKRLFTFFLVLQVASLFNLTKVSADKIDSLGNYRVDDIVVTSTRTPLPLKNTPVITRVISGREIEKQGIASLENLLERELAGVEFHQAGYGTTLSFQGLDARYVLFLMDGERMAGETYGNIDYNRIPISSIERIEIVRGASSVLYGSNAMGAVVNIITKMPSERMEISGSVRYGTRFQNNDDELLGEGTSKSDLNKYHNKLDLPNIKADVSAGFNLGKLRSLSSVTLQTVDAYKLRGRKDEKRHYKELQKMMPVFANGGILFDESGIPVFNPSGVDYDTTILVSPDSRGLAVSGYRDWYVSQKFDYELNRKFRFELSGNYFNKERYDFLTSVMDDNPMSGYFQSKEAWKYESYQGYNARFLMEHSPNDLNKIYLTYTRDEYFRYQEQLHSSRVPKQRHTYNNPRLLWTWNPGESHRLTTGLELINERLRFDLSSDPRGFDDVKSINTGALYIQDELFTDRKLSFVLGLRGDWSDKFGGRVTPKVSAKYNFSNFALRANYSNGYRTPNLKEMYMELDIPIASSPKIEGNPDLKSETNNYLSLSLDYNLPRLNMSATVSKSYFKNKIDARWIYNTEEGKQVLRYDNIDKSELGSIELIGRFRIAKSLFLNANYNYIFQSDNAPEGSTQYIFPSPHTATFSVDYAFMMKKLRIGVNANVRYIGAKDYEDFMPYINLPQSLIDFLTGASSQIVVSDMRLAKYYTGNYRSHHDGYAVCNASIDIQLPQGVSFTVGVDNLFDYRPPVVNFNSALLPGVNGFVKVSFAL